jgi:hypothetical protein
MSNDPKSEQFAGFAKALYRKLAENVVQSDKGLSDMEAFITEQHQIIARAAYDLAQHMIGHTLEYLHECGISTSGGMGKRILPSIPDMPELPEEKSE